MAIPVGDVDPVITVPIRGGVCSVGVSGNVGVGLKPADLEINRVGKGKRLARSRNLTLEKTDLRAFRGASREVEVNVCEIVTVTAMSA